MNQFDIEDELDKLLEKAETDLEKVFAKRLKAILFQISEMYRKYEKNGELGFTELNKYNRFQKEMERIASMFTDDYKGLVKDIQELQETQYVAKYLMTAYLIDQSISTLSLPSNGVIREILLALIKRLRLPEIPEYKLSKTVKIISKEFSIGIEKNESIAALKKRLEHTLGFASGKSQETASILTISLVERIEPSVNLVGFTIPSTETVRTVLENPIKELTLPKILEQHRNDIVRQINIEIAQSIQAGEGYSTMAKRLEKKVGLAANKAKVVARTEAGRARSIASEKVYEKASEFTKTTKVWASSLDNRVRRSHQSLDSKEADKNGVFHYKGNYATAPRLWVGKDAASLTINCRCSVIYKVNGKLPEYRRSRDYMDDKYQQKLADRIVEYMADDGLTYKQAIKKAQKEINPPSRVIPYVTYEEWKDKITN